MQKNPLFFTMWGMAKATDTPVTVWGGQIARKWEESQAMMPEGDFLHPDKQQLLCQ